jgi:hypothetical protein
VGYRNFKEYFVIQYKNPDVQEGYSAEEYNMGRILKELGPDWRGVILLRYGRLRTFKFLMYGDDSWIQFRPYSSIPIRQDDGKNYIYMLVTENLPVAQMLKEIYPHGEYGEYRPLFIGKERSPYFFTYKVPNSDIKEALKNMGNHGLDGYYYENPEWKANPITVTVEPFLFFRHFYNPVRLPYSMDYRGKIKIDRAGEYKFILEASNDSWLYIDGKKVVEIDSDDKKTNYSATGYITLSPGYHKLRVKYVSTTSHMELELRWKPPFAQKEEIVPYRVLYRE